MNKLKRNQKGFTIVELMIATTVFAVVLLLCTYGLLETGRTYYKGVTISRTQETARIIVDDVADSIQFNGGEIVTGQPGWHCIGTKRYSFELNRQLDDTNHGLISDVPGNCSPGTGINPALNGGSLSDTTTEMLSNRTRISQFDVIEIGDDLYSVTVRVVSGESDLLIDRNNDGNISTVDNPIECKNERTGSQFCAIAELSTVVQKRVR